MCGGQILKNPGIIASYFNTRRHSLGLLDFSSHVDVSGVRRQREGVTFHLKRLQQYFS